MTETAQPKSDASLTDTVERIRAEQFPDLDRTLVLEMLRLHAGPPLENLNRLIDEAIVARSGGDT